MMKLTLRQQEVLNLLIDYQRKHGFPPDHLRTDRHAGVPVPQCGGNPSQGVGEKRGHQDYPRGFPRYQHHQFAFNQGGIS